MKYTIIFALLVVGLSGFAPKQNVALVNEKYISNKHVQHQQTFFLVSIGENPWMMKIRTHVMAPVDLSGGGQNPCGGSTNYAYNTENGKYYCVGQTYIYETSPPYGCTNC